MLYKHITYILPKCDASKDELCYNITAYIATKGVLRFCANIIKRRNNNPLRISSYYGRARIRENGTHLYRCGYVANNGGDRNRGNGDLGKL